MNLVTFSDHLRVNLLAAGPLYQRLAALDDAAVRISAAIKALPIKLPEREWPVSLVTAARPDIETRWHGSFIDHLRETAKSLAAP